MSSRDMSRGICRKRFLPTRYINENHINRNKNLYFHPRANGAKRRSGRKPGAKVTNSARLFTPGKMRTQRSATAGKFAAAVQK